MKIVRNKSVRPQIQEKINKALASKPTANYLQSRGYTPEEIQLLHGAPPPRRMKTKGRGRPNKRPAFGRAERITPVFKSPKYSEFSSPVWFQTNGNFDVSIIVPMYNSKIQIREQIETWDLADDGLAKEIIYVDDGCPQRSFEEVISSWNNKKSVWDRPIGRIVINDDNAGFAFSCNTGAKFATGKYLIFLNADCVVTHNWIRPMVDLIKSNPEIGIVGNLQLKKGSKIIESAGSEWSKGQFEHIGRNVYNGQRLAAPFTLENLPDDLKVVGERQMVTGSCLLIPKGLFEQVEGFDIGYRIGYWEDSDLNMKVKASGYKVFYQPKSVIYHTPGHSQSNHNSFVNQNKQKFTTDWVDTGTLSLLLKNKPKPLITPLNAVVYTAITSGYDSLIDLQNTQNGSKFTAFLENASAQSSTWEIKPLKKEFPDSNRSAKIYKVLSHKYFPDCEYSLWIDGNVRLLQPLDSLIKVFLCDVDLALFKHPERSCLYDEANVCASRGLDDATIINKQIARYRAEGFPQNVGLSECTILLRRHTPLMAKFNEAWWEEICKGSKRDQISFPYVAKKIGIKYNYFPGNLRVGTFSFQKTATHRRK